MVSQEKISPNGAAGAARLRRNLWGFAHDVATLLELQCRLLAVDARDARRLLVPGAALAIAGGIVGLASLPVALAAGALALSELAGWSFALSFALTALACLVVAGVLGAMGWSRLRRSLGAFDRSRVELRHTYRWIRRSLRPTSDHGAGV